MNLLYLNNHQLLLGNLYEINAQLNFNLENYMQVEFDLEKSSQLLQQADPGHLLMIQKWKILTQLKTTTKNSQLIKDLQTLKSKAVHFKEWELIRDCDLHLATCNKNHDLLLQVYWGTLYKQFKKRIINLGLNEKSIHAFYYWKFGQSNYNLDLQSLAPTALLKSVFYYLTRDFYRPIRAIELFSLVYQNEYYNPVTSPKKLQTLIKRSRQWLLANKIPLEIKNYRNEYKLVATQPLCLKVHSAINPANIQKKHRSLDQFKKILFTTKDYAKVFQVSQRTAQREIQNHLQHQRMKSIGFSVAKKYKII